MTPPVAAMHAVPFEQAMSTSCARSMAVLKACRPALPASMPAKGPVFMLKPTQSVRANGTSVSCCFSTGSLLYRIRSSGVGPPLLGPSMLKLPDSYLVSCAFWSAMTSMWTLVSAPVEPPHQFGTGAKSSDCLGVRAVILNCPVPTNVDGSVNHLSSPPPAVMAFWSTTHAVHSATSVYQ